MNTDFLYIFHWWSILFLVGIIFLPTTLVIFKNFFDKGYLFSKTIGIAVVSYTVFLLGTMHITPFTQFTVIVVLILSAIGNIVVFHTHVLSRNVTGNGSNPSKKGISSNSRKILGKLPRFLLVSKQEIRNDIKIFLFEELLFFSALWFWSYVRGFSPDIHELEKFMDFGFVNSILRSTYFPPRDMWFTPFPINYYYFGHFVTAVLTRLSGIPSNISFNLMLGTLFAFCFTGAFTLGANIWFLLKGSRILVFFTGFLSALLLTFGGNLHVVYAFFKSYGNDNPVPPWQLPFLLYAFPNAYWYPNATRFIYHTIHEFPMYSFVVSDLHGHVLDIPFVLVTLAVLLALIINCKLQIANLLFLGFLVAIMYMTNAWDGLMYFGLAAVFVGVIIKQKLSVSFFDTTFFLEFFPKIAIIFGCFLLFSLPFSLFFQPGEIAHGIGILCAPKFLTDKGKIGPFLFEANHCQHSPWWQLLILYGFFYIWVLPFFVFLWKKRKEKQMVSDTFVLLLILFATFLIIIPEFVYLKDIYPEHYRANTMFKLVYQSFMLLSLASGYIIVRFFKVISTQKPRIKKIIFIICYLLPTTFLIILVAWLYPYFAITSYYGNLKNYQSLDGTAYLKSLYPTDYAAINWLNNNISGQPVILEAQGDSYTDYARVSSNTGLPTVLGWTVHEWLWRGTYDVPAPRITDVQNLYQTTDIPTALSLIRKYNVTYVFIGDMERKKYPTLQIDKFNQLGKVIYQNGTTIIYQITI